MMRLFFVICAMMLCAGCCGKAALTIVSNVVSNTKDYSECANKVSSVD